MPEDTDIDTAQIAPQTYEPQPAPPGAPSNKILHNKCKKVTDIGRHLGDEHRRLPEFFVTLPCNDCGGNFPVAEFTWADGTAFDKIVDKSAKPAQ